MGLWDFITGSGEPSKTFEGEGHNWSHDWCRFRKNSHCFYPKTLNDAATKAAGYAVWNPEDRGYCPRIAWRDQQECPVSEPGPNVPGGFLDATVPWDQGGQRGGIPARSYRASAEPQAPSASPTPTDEDPSSGNGLLQSVRADGAHTAPIAHPRAHLELAGTADTAEKSRSTAEQLTRLAELYRAGELTDEEFSHAKQRVFEVQVPSPDSAATGADPT